MKRAIYKKKTILRLLLFEKGLDLSLRRPPSHKSYDVRCLIVLFGNSTQMAAPVTLQNVSIATNYTQKSNLNDLLSGRGYMGAGDEIIMKKKTFFRQ